MTDPRPRPDVLAVNDQLQATLVGQAPVWGAYYRGLLAGGCDEHLARALVLDAHHIVNSTPQPPQEDAA